MIINADCLEIMKTYKDNEFDFIITDPPWGIRIAEWDSTIPPQIYFDEMFRISKKQIIFGGNHYPLPLTEGWILWYKQPCLKTQSQVEMLWTNFIKKTKLIHYQYAGNVEGYPGKIRVDYKKEKCWHPTMKPVELLRNIIRTYVKEGETILDPFAGSGSTGVAAKLENKEFTLIEKNEIYFNNIKKRLDE